MTDFFSGLLDRALNRAPVLERRRPSLFEPVPAAGRLGFARPGPLSQEGEGVSDSQPEPAPKAELRTFPKSQSSVLASPQTIRRAENSSVEAVRLSDKPATVTPLAIGSQRKAPEVAAMPLAPARQTPKMSPTVLPTHRIETVVLKETQRHESSAVNSTSPASLMAKPVAPRITPSASEAPARPALRTRADTRPETRPRREAVETHRTELVPARQRRSETPPVLMPASRPVQAPASSRVQAAREIEPAPPAIHVTIGRIEVRATAPAVAPTPGARRAAPTLSLEDYLRSRGGGTK